MRKTIENNTNGINEPINHSDLTGNLNFFFWSSMLKTFVLHRCTTLHTDTYTHTHIDMVKATFKFQNDFFYC